MLRQVVQKPDIVLLSPNWVFCWKIKMEIKEIETLQIALVNLKNAGDEIEDSNLRWKIDDFIDEIEQYIQDKCLRKDKE